MIEPTAPALIERFAMVPHPEGGHYVETWRDHPEGGGRGVGTAILFLLQEGERSHWHRVDADECWFHHAGAPLALSISADDHTAPTTTVVGPDLLDGHEPMARVPATWWQSAESLGAWTLVSCTVSPAFEFEHFELAPERFAPGSEPGNDEGPG